VFTRDCAFGAFTGAAFFLRAKRSGDGCRAHPVSWVKENIGTELLQSTNKPVSGTLRAERSM